METREEILGKIKARKTYCTLTPHMYVDSTRSHANIFTCLDYTSQEIKGMVDTDEAVRFTISIIELLENATLAQGEEPVITSLPCELSYFVDSRIRTEKNFRVTALQEEDILDGINCVTIFYPNIQDKSQKFYDHRTFIVDLDEFIKSIDMLGLSVFFGRSKGKNQDIKSKIVKEGLASSPPITLIHSYHTKKMDKDSKKI